MRKNVKHKLKLFLFVNKGWKYYVREIIPAYNLDAAIIALCQGCNLIYTRKLERYILAESSETEDPVYLDWYPY